MQTEYFIVARYKGNQYGILSSSGLWLCFGKKKDLEKRVEELNKLNWDKQPIDWDKE
jgi:hypothetical protein